MENQVDPLSQLIDIQLPVAPSVWPPAPGWWVLALLALLIIFAICKKITRYNKANRPTKEFIRRINNLEIDSKNPRSCFDFLSAILKQYAIHKFGREAVSGLSGSQWIDFLDQHTRSGSGFSDGAGSVFGNEAYLPGFDTDVAALKSFLINWARGKV